jgi:hypothetical protein
MFGDEDATLPRIVATSNVSDDVGVHVIFAVGTAETVAVGLGVAKLAKNLLDGSR